MIKNTDLHYGSGQKLHTLYHYYFHYTKYMIFIHQK